MYKMPIYKLIILTLLSILTSINSAEVDTEAFKKYYTENKYHDLIPGFNKIINNRLSKCIENTQYPYFIKANCYRWFSSGIHNELEDEILKFYPKMTYSKSIIFKDNFIYSKLGEVILPKGLQLSQIFPFKYNNKTYYIGIDKIEHLLDTSYIFNTESMSQLSEYTFYGYLASFIYSYSDLYANYIGKKFWDSFESYYECSSSRMCKKIKDIDLNDYLSPLLDESINFSYSFAHNLPKYDFKSCPLEDVDLSPHPKSTINPELFQVCS